MGVFLDTSVAVKAQRSGMDETAMLVRVRQIVGADDLASSALVLAELLVGVHRARDPKIRQRRQSFVDDLTRHVPIHPFLVETAELAGKLGGERGALGETIPFADLMIGATALSLGYAVLTTNVRHFQLISGLRVIPF